MAKGNSAIYDDVFNEVMGKDANKPDTEGIDLYFGGYDAVISMHGSHGPDAMMEGTPNAKQARDLYGGPVKGEPNPVGMKGQG